MRRRALAVAAVAAVLSLAGAAAADAGPPGKWTKVTGPDRNIDEVGLARTSDGVLHVLWPSQQGLGGNVLHSSIASNAKSIGGPDTVFSYPNGLNSRMALIAVDGGLQAFFSGLFGSESAPLHVLMATATSSDGKSWAVQPTPASNSSPAGRSPVYVASGIGAVRGSGGVPIFAWGDSGPGEAGYHFGTSSADPDLRFSSECCVYAPNVGVDGLTGQAVLAWKFIHNSGSGTALQSISPGGGRVVPPGAAASDGSTRTAISGRIGAGGVYVAYQLGTNQFQSRPALVRVGASKAKKLSGASGAQMIGVAPAPQGRLWVFWMRNKRLYAVRSNKKVSRFGKTVRVKPPKGTNSVYNLAGEGSRGWLDLLTLVQVSSTIGNWHQRVGPGLTLSAKGKKGKVTAKVTDAGDPVKGAKVKVGKQAKKTKGNGRVSFSVAKGKYKVKASKTGYTSASKTVKAK